jgi:hypothetical protein
MVILKIIQIIEKVLSGKMNSLKELYESWPETTTGNVVFENIYDDIESVIEHLSILQNSGIDENLFHKSIDYRNLVIDYKVLNRGFDLELTSKLIVELRKKIILSIDEIDEEISDFLN